MQLNVDSGHPQKLEPTDVETLFIKNTNFVRKKKLKFLLNIN